MVKHHYNYDGDDDGGITCECTMCKLWLDRVKPFYKAWPIELAQIVSYLFFRVRDLKEDLEAEHTYYKTLLDDLLRLEMICIVNERLVDGQWVLGVETMQTMEDVNHALSRKVK